MKPTSDELRLAEELLADGNQEAWEKGRLGRDPKHARRLSEDDAQRYLGEKKGTSIRLPDDLIADLRALAERKGLAYQAYLRMVLIEHVRAQRRA
jgi:predicted DNA binding CopG/RHH family protein